MLWANNYENVNNMTAIHYPWNFYHSQTSASKTDKKNVKIFGEMHQDRKHCMPHGDVEGDITPLTVHKFYITVKTSLEENLHYKVPICALH